MAAHVAFPYLLVLVELHARSVVPTSVFGPHALRATICVLHEHKRRGHGLAKMVLTDGTLRSPRGLTKIILEPTRLRGILIHDAPLTFDDVC